MDLQQFDIPRYLANLPLFEEIAPADLQRLAQGCRLRNFSRGENIFSVGMPCEEFHVTITGQVKLFALSPSGQEKVIELAGPGISFAEALVFTGKPYIINAQALSESIVLSVGKAAVVREIEDDPRFAMRMLAGISRRLHGLVHDVQAYSLHNGMQRVIDYLLHPLEENPATSSALKVSLPVSKATIASRLSITPEYFSRVLHELESAGLISVDKREIHIPNAARLASHCA
ncbi:MAG: Crp/Fnr family transcriptional regulator [Comamonas sp.]|nr:Crp/Fnr family transcriptional regulator [Comamonas sp.]